MQNSGGWTAIHEAAVNGQGEVIEQLAALGASIHDRTKEGDTALHKAARWGHASVVKLLLSLGSSVNIADNVRCYPSLSPSRLCEPFHTCGACTCAGDAHCNCIECHKEARPRSSGTVSDA